jgi:hypothetical protein
MNASLLSHIFRDLQLRVGQLRFFLLLYNNLPVSVAERLLRDLSGIGINAWGRLRASLVTKTTADARNPCLMILANICRWGRLEKQYSFDATKVQLPFVSHAAPDMREVGIAANKAIT